MFLHPWLPVLFHCSRWRHLFQQPTQEILTQIQQKKCCFVIFQKTLGEIHSVLSSSYLKEWVKVGSQFWVHKMQSWFLHCLLIIVLFSFFLFLILTWRYIHWFQRKRERKREREKREKKHQHNRNINWLPPAHALTRGWTWNPQVHRTHSNQLTHPARANCCVIFPMNKCKPTFAHPHMYVCVCMYIHHTHTIHYHTCMYVWIYIHKCIHPGVGKVHLYILPYMRACMSTHTHTCVTLLCTLLYFRLR